MEMGVDPTSETVDCVVYTWLQARQQCWYLLIRWSETGLMDGIRSIPRKLALICLTNHIVNSLIDNLRSLTLIFCGTLAQGDISICYLWRVFRLPLRGVSVV